MKIPKKRGRPRLSEEEKARRKSEREAAKAAALKAGHGKANKTVSSIKSKKDKVEIKTTNSFLLTPSGKCPVELYGNDKEAIAVWVSHVRNYKPKNVQHTLQSIRYWLRDFYYIHSKEYKIAEENLKEIIATFDIIDYEPFLKKQYESINREKNENIMD